MENLEPVLQMYCLGCPAYSFSSNNPDAGPEATRSDSPWSRGFYLTSGAAGLKSGQPDQKGNFEKANIE
jgi:hypothetical protein